MDDYQLLMLHFLYNLAIFCVKNAKLIHLTREAPFFVYANAHDVSIQGWSNGM